MLADLETLLPLSLVREHIADDDTESFSDDQLGLYREAAFEACELYTGQPIDTGIRQVSEEIMLPRGFSVRAGQDFLSPSFHRLKEPATFGIVAVTSSYGAVQEVQIAPGGSLLPLWMLAETINFGGTSCEFGRMPPQQTFVATYQTGVVRPRPLASGMKLGILKFIAWSVTNAGDTVVTVTGSMSSSRDTQVSFGTNNVAVASGAVDLWRQYARNLVR